MQATATTVQARETQRVACRLEVPPEPSELRHELGVRVSRGEGLDPGLVADRLWRGWGESLEAAGIDREDFERVVGSYGRELWLWVMGERTWPQCGEGLAGRLLRRLAP